MVVTLDTLRADRLDARHMPSLAAWSGGGTRFERCYASSPVTQPTHATLFTGLHPWQHGVTRNGIRLDAAHETLAERLLARDFSTAAVVSSVPVARRFGYAQGFERFDEDFDRGRGGATWPRIGAKGDTEAFYALAERTTRNALATLDRAGHDGRQLFWFHFFDPHDPYGDTGSGATLDPRQVLMQPESTREATAGVARAGYDADVAFLDRALAPLLARLDADGARVVTHVVLTADHGESLGHDGSFGHGRRLNDAQLRVPCVVRSPRLEPGVRSDVVGTVDLAATLFAIAGLEAPPHGRDLSLGPVPDARAFGMRRTFERPTRDRRMDGTRPLLADPFFYAVAPDGTIARGTAEESPVFARFAQELSAAPGELVRDAETLEQLRALGYVE